MPDVSWTVSISLVESRGHRRIRMNRPAATALPGHPGCLSARAAGVETRTWTRTPR